MNTKTLVIVILILAAYVAGGAFERPSSVTAAGGDVQSLAYCPPSWLFEKDSFTVHGDKYGVPTGYTYIEDGIVYAVKHDFRCRDNDKWTD